MTRGVDSAGTAAENFAAGSRTQEGLPIFSGGGGGGGGGSKSQFSQDDFLEGPDGGPRGGFRPVGRGMAGPRDARLDEPRLWAPDGCCSEDVGPIRAFGRRRTWAIPAPCRRRGPTARRDQPARPCAEKRGRSQADRGEPPAERTGLSRQPLLLGGFGFRGRPGPSVFAPRTSFPREMKPNMRSAGRGFQVRGRRPRYRGRDPRAGQRRRCASRAAGGHPR